ncbi:hypothetical protein DM860_015271 [Cuscuta australis]|uniref:Uncharacterized protein n=1 Tax=Cuscuta australis TaxID=267555 RepID=A0A328D1N5_9ASTE|nr:hypothetical protein DM860_015271 [Cuscuta australis]
MKILNQPQFTVSFFVFQPRTDRKETALSPLSICLRSGVISLRLSFTETSDFNLIMLGDSIGAKFIVAKMTLESLIHNRFMGEVQRCDAIK